MFVNNDQSFLPKHFKSSQPRHAPQVPILMCRTFQNLSAWDFRAPPYIWSWFRMSRWILYEIPKRYPTCSTALLVITAINMIIALHCQVVGVDIVTLSPQRTHYMMFEEPTVEILTNVGVAGSREMSTDEPYTRATQTSPVMWQCERML